MKIPEPIRLFNTAIHPIRFRDVVRFIDTSLKTHRRAILFPMNIHILVELSKNPNIKKAHEAADIIFCDGIPLVWFSHVNSQSLPERVSGTDLVETFLKKPYRISLLGSTPQVLTLMKQKYPSVCRTLSPPFEKEWGRREIRKMVQTINATKPDILFVALGSLRQELWILNNFSQIRVPVTIAIGSALDILSGKTPRAPRWMQQFGLEWLWRIIVEPQRLIPRYTNDLRSLVCLLRNRQIRRR